MIVYPDPRASLVSAECLIYVTFDDGTAHLISLGETFDIVAENPVDEGMFPSPVFSQGQILIKGDRHLFCIGK